MSIQVDREKAIEAAMTQIERHFGKGSIMKLGSQAVLDVPVISDRLPCTRQKDLKWFCCPESRLYKSFPLHH